MSNEIYLKKSTTRLCQGDLVEGFVYSVVKPVEDSIEFDEISFPFAIIVSQDCDLQQDYNNRNNLTSAITTTTVVNHDKYIDSVIVLPAHLAESVKQGTHLNNLGFTMQTFGRDQWKSMQNNKVERYHLLKKDEKNGIPELAIDFKHSYTISRNNLYQMFADSPDQFKFSIGPLFREDLSRRYANFISRIALPELNELPVPNASPAQPGGELVSEGA